MSVFHYRGRTGDGLPSEGSVEAPNSAVAAGRVKAMGVDLEWIREASAPPGTAQPARRAEAPRRTQRAEWAVASAAPGIPLAELAAFFRQFATLIHSGVPIVQSVGSLERSVRSAKLRSILAECSRRLGDGERLSDVMEGYPSAFPPLALEMIRAGETGGMLEAMLFRIADHLERELEMRRLMARLTMYPKLVVVTAFLLLGRSGFTEMTPAFSRWVIGMMGMQRYTTLDYLSDTVFALGAILAAWWLLGAGSRVAAARWPGYGVAIERLKMATPGLGAVVREFALTRFGRALGALYGSGLPLGSAVAVAGRASGSASLARASEGIAVKVSSGYGLCASMQETGFFPHTVLEMVSTGEQTGNLDAMLEKMAEYLEADAQSKAHMHAHLFATGVYLLVAAMVGLAVARFYMGYGSAAGQAAAGVGWINLL
ncbi:MAG: type II secretion system F family protein [Armatimonadetes bacterium]|nr:type II secretion system F family protein [Armatimonadota bacterium]